MKNTIYIIYFFLFISCDCWQFTKGKVYEYGTKIPMDSVLIKTYTMGRLTREHYTNSEGYFESSTTNTGRCGDFLKLTFEKNGYIIQEINNPSKEIEVFMKK